MRSTGILKKKKHEICCSGAMSPRAVLRGCGMPVYYHRFIKKHKKIYIKKDDNNVFKKKTIKNLKKT